MVFKIRHAVRRLFRAQKIAETPIEEKSQKEEVDIEIGEKEAPIRFEKAEHAGHIPLPKGYETVEAKVDILGKLRAVAETYPLVTTLFRGMRYVVATANIRFNPVTNQLMYIVEEPTLSDSVKDVIKETLKLLQDRLEIEPSKLKARKEVYHYVDAKVNEIWDYLGASLTEDEELKAKYYILRDTIGYGPLEPLMRDPNIEDISCDGVGSPVFVFHRNSLYGEVITNVTFSTKEELDSFVMKLAQKAGRTISVATPLLDATLPDGSRLQVTFGTDIARKGSNFSIRKFFKLPLTVVDLVQNGTVDPLLMAYLWLLIDEQQSLLISGTTAVGKTTFLNSIAEFIKPTQKIVSIEDTAELQLTNVNWVPQVARTGYGPKKYGEVTMFDLLKAALRQRPDYLIVGEVRGREASVMFQAMASIPGDEKVIVVDETGQTRLISIAEASKLEKLRVPTFSLNPGEVSLEKVKACVSHGPRKILLKIKTKTGREIITTPNHSLFGYENGELVPCLVESLGVGDRIAIPAKLPSGFADIKHINLLDLPGVRVIAPDLVKEAVRKLGYTKAEATIKSISKFCYQDIQKKYQLSALPATKFKKLMSVANINYDLSKISVRFDRKSKAFPALLRLTPELLRLIGYYISEGTLNTAKKNNSIALYSKNPKILADMRYCIRTVCGTSPKERQTKGWGTAIELRFNHKVLFEFLKTFAGAKSKNKTIPNFMFGLPKEKIGSFLAALYDGDGHFGRTKFEYYTASKELANQLLHLLLIYGLVAKVRERKGTKLPYWTLTIYRSTDRKALLNYVKPLKLVPLLPVGRVKEQNLINDIYLDEVKSIQTIRLSEEKEVYDFCVPGTQNFIGGFGGVILHNTGHPALSTLHADSLNSVMDRLTTRPIDLPISLLENLDAIVFLEKTKKDGRMLRRTGQILEIEGYDVKSGRLKTNVAFSWNPVKDIYEAHDSVILAKIAARTGQPPEKLRDELLRRANLLRWMSEKNITKFRDVARVINLYYTDPAQLATQMRT